MAVFGPLLDAAVASARAELAVTLSDMGGLDVTLAGDTIGGDRGASAGRAARVLVVYEPCPTGRAALREAAELANAGSELTVVTLAPQARPLLWGKAGGEGPYNIAVREEAEMELRQARDILGSVAGRAAFTVLAGTCPPLAPWAAAQAFDLVLLPHHRFTPGGSHLARGLRRATFAEVRLVR